MSELSYVDYRREDRIYKPLEWQLQGRAYTASGYGGKIPTAYMLRHNGRLKRVYCMIYSNSGTAYILSNGKRLILRDV